MGKGRLVVENAPLDQRPDLLPVESDSRINLRKASSEFWPYAGMDSTAICEIQILDIESDEEEENEKNDFSEWETLCANEKIPLEAKIKEGIDRLHDLAKKYNLLINQTQKDLAKKAIWLGKYLNALKELVRKKGELWGVWAEENIPFISKRNREKYMRIAKREDCHKFALLGVERLDLLCSATEDTKSPDAIERLFKDYNITFDPMSEENLADFKNKVDAAINSEKLKKNEIEAPFELVQDLTEAKIKFDNRLIKKLIDIKDSNGDPKKYLEKLSMNGGRGSTESDTEKRLQDFNTLANKLIKTIDYITASSDYISKVDRETFENLWQKMDKLREKGNFITAQAGSS